MKRSLFVALVITLGVGLWIGSGMLDPEASAPSAQKAPAAVDHLGQMHSVRVREQSAQEHEQVIALRGATEARRAVNLRSQTFGMVMEILAEENTLVSQGQKLIQLDEAERDAQLREAKALLRQRSIEYEAARKLATKGYRSETERAGSAAALEAAQAAVEAAQIELNHTAMTAPFSGLVERHIMEVGDFADRGDTILRLVELNPLRVVAFANEREVMELRLGMEGQAVLSTGRSIPGRIAYLAQEAEAQTRTFQVELEIDNRDFAVPAGVTADIVVTLQAQPAQKISPALLTLDREGRMGVKVLDETNHVRFLQVEVVDDELDGLWVTGLPQRATIITVGQEFVRDGEEVRPIAERDSGLRATEEVQPAT
ncbi:MAG: multidrug efflux RND transporter periplasmic adaptor subunit VmeJ [Rhodospirillales bacterium]